MASTLGSDIPPAPNPGSTNALSSGSAPQGAAPSGTNALQGGPAAIPQMPGPAPTHAQVVAALRHFDAIGNELKLILEDPNLGKSNLKGKIIDGMTRLVSEQFLQPAEAVSELSKVPSEPLMQMKWAKMMLQQTQNAEQAVLMHHAIGYAGQGPLPTPDAEGHGDALNAFVGGLKGGQAGG